MPRDGSSCIRAVVRLRPLLRHEVERGEEDCCEVSDANSMLIRMGSGGNEWRKYAFDACLPNDRSQKQIFQESGITTLLDSSIEGYSSTVLAYGQTGSGKTHTMIGPLGTPDAVGHGDEVKRDDGVIMRSAKRLFRRIGSGDSTRYSISASFMEIFNAPGAVNECISDLLSPDNGNLQVRHNKKQGFFVSELCVVDCKSVADVRAVLEAGVHNRKVGAHAMNKDSSRSHALFTLHIDSEKPDDEGGPPVQHFGKIAFVDLAGSERLKESLAEGNARKETQAINKSLFTLGQVISQLAQGAQGKHVPYRNSKLTQLLQESFGGESLCLMITCISPAATYAEESLNSLNYAHKAMNIRNRPVVRLDEHQQFVRDLKSENAAMRRELEAYRARYGALSPRASRALASTAGVADGVFDVEPNCPGDSHRPSCAELPGVLEGEPVALAAAAAEAAKPSSRGASRDRLSSPSAVARSRSRDNEVDERTVERRSRGCDDRSPRRVVSAPERAATSATDVASTSSPKPPLPEAVRQPQPPGGGGSYAKAAAKRQQLQQNQHRRPPQNGGTPAGRALPPLPGRSPGGASSSAGGSSAGGGHSEVNVGQISGIADDCTPSAASGGNGKRSGGRGTAPSRGFDGNLGEGDAVSAMARAEAQRQAAQDQRVSRTISTPAPATIPTIKAPPSNRACVSVAASNIAQSSALAVNSEACSTQDLRKSSSSEILPKLTNAQLERLDSSHPSEWQVEFGRQASKDGGQGIGSSVGVPSRRSSIGQASSRRDVGSRPCSRGGGSRPSSRGGSAPGSRCSSRGGYSTRSASRGSSACSSRSSDSRNSAMKPGRPPENLHRAAAEVAATVDESRIIPAEDAAIAPPIPKSMGGQNPISLADLNSKLASMTMATNSLMLEAGVPLR